MGNLIRLRNGAARWLGTAFDTEVDHDWSTSNTMFGTIRRMFEWLHQVFNTNDAFRSRFSFGDESAFNGAATFGTKIKILSSSVGVAIYSDDATGDEGKIRAFSYLGNKIQSWGIEKEFEAGATTGVDTCTIDLDADDPTIGISYIDGGDSSKAKAIAASVNLTTLIVTIGAVSVINAVDSSGSDTDIDLVAPGKVSVTYRDEGGDDYACLRVAEVTGVTFGTWGTEVELNAASATFIGHCPFDTNKLLAHFVDAGGLTVIVCTIDGTTPTAGTEVVITTDTCIDVDAESHDTNKVLIGYQNSTASGDPLYIAAGLIVGTVPGFTTLKAITETATTQIDISAIDEHHAAVVYTRNGRGCIQMLHISGGAPIASDEYVFNDAASLSNAISNIDENRFIIACEDDGGADYGIAIIATRRDSQKKLHAEAKMSQGTSAAAQTFEVWGSGVLRMLSLVNSTANNWTAVLEIDGLSTSMTASGSQDSTNYVALNGANPDSADEFVLDTSITAPVMMNLEFRDHVKLTATPTADNLSYKIYYTQDAD